MATGFDKYEGVGAAALRRVSTRSTGASAADWQRLPDQTESASARAGYDIVLDDPGDDLAPHPLQRPAYAFSTPPEPSRRRWPVFGSFAAAAVIQLAIFLWPQAIGPALHLITAAPGETSVRTFRDSSSIVLEADTRRPVDLDNAIGAAPSQRGRLVEQVEAVAAAMADDLNR